jgi:hypothetical protein
MPDFANAKLINHLTFEGNWPSAVAFVDNQQLVAGNLDGQLYLWDLAAPAAELSEEQKQDHELKDRLPNIYPVRRLEGHTNGVTRLIYDDKGRQLVSASLEH